MHLKQIDKHETLLRHQIANLTPFFVHLCHGIFIKGLGFPHQQKTSLSLMTLDNYDLYNNHVQATQKWFD